VSGDEEGFVVQGLAVGQGRGFPTKHCMSFIQSSDKVIDIKKTVGEDDATFDMRSRQQIAKGVQRAIERNEPSPATIDEVGTRRLHNRKIPLFEKLSGGYINEQIPQVPMIGQELELAQIMQRRDDGTARFHQREE